MSAVQAMEVLQKSSNKVGSHVKSIENDTSESSSTSSSSSCYNNSLMNNVNNANNVNGDFTFIHEEDVHHEAFFVPCIWEVIVEVVTRTFLKWNSDKLSLLEYNNTNCGTTTTTSVSGVGLKDESSALLKNAEDIV